MTKKVHVFFSFIFTEKKKKKRNCLENMRSLCPPVTIILTLDSFNVRIQVILSISDSNWSVVMFTGCPLKSINNRYILPTNQHWWGEHSESHMSRFHPVKRKPVWSLCNDDENTSTRHTSFHSTISKPRRQWSPIWK
jgi:hypothetical protein